MAEAPAVLADTIDAKVLLSVLAKVREGDFSARMPLEWTGVAGKVADGFNDVIVANQMLGAELARVSRVVGKQGELSQRVVRGGWGQSWSDSVESVNSLIDDLVRPTAVVTSGRRGVEGPDRQRESAGRQSHQPGAGDLRGRHGGHGG